MIFGLLGALLLTFFPAAAQHAAAAPTGLQADNVEAGVRLTWEAPEADAGSVTGYRILTRQPEYGEAFYALVDDTATTSASYVDTSADEADAVYAYQVQALRGGVASASSATAVVVTPPPIPDDDELPDDADSVYLGAEDLGDISDQDEPRFPDYALDGDGDRVDYVRFTLTAAKKVSLGLRQLDADADLILEDADGTVLGESRETGDDKEWLSLTLLAGAYYIRIESQEIGANAFKLRYGVSAPDAGEVARLRVPVAEPVVDTDATRDGAIDLGDLTAVTKARYPAYTLDGDGDRVDYVRFTLTAAKTVSLGLRQLDADADLILEDADGTVLGESRRTGDDKEWLSLTLLAGAYYIRIESREIAANAFKLRYGVSAPDAGEVAALEKQREEKRDRPPVFGQSRYVFSLLENADGSTNRVMLGTVSATDPEDARLTYGIEEGNAAGLFEIDSGSGELFYVGAGEDFESGTSGYDLTVRANDGRQNAQTYVTVTVANVAEATGSAIKIVDYSDPIWASRRFNYDGGWAGWGFGLTGSQRGAPEYIDIAEVDSVTALRLKSAERNQAWYDEHPAVVDHAVYGHPDAETQDDFFLYATGWTREENPYLLAQVYLGNFESSTSLRMKVRYENASHNEVRGFPGIFYYGYEVVLRGPGRPDVIKIPPNHQGPGWVTLGMTVTGSGDIIYVGKSGTHSLAELFASPDFKYRNSEISRSGFYYPVAYSSGQGRAVGMFSQRTYLDAPNAIAYIEFGKNLVVEDTTVNNAR